SSSLPLPERVRHRPRRLDQLKLFPARLRLGALPQARSSLGTLPPFSASFCSTVLCSHMFICAESPILSAGQPSSVPSAFRAAKLLSRPRSLSRSTIDTFQLSFSRLEAARPSSLATTSTTGIAAGGAGTGAAGAGSGGGEDGVGAAGPVWVAERWKPSFSRMLPNRLMVCPPIHVRSLEARVPAPR